MESRADYNNNPGNLRPPKDVTYEGQIGQIGRAHVLNSSH
mgnify:CR=1 FL=1